MQPSDRVRADRATKEESPKARSEYEAPKLVVIGQITDFTFGSGGSKSDAGTFTRL